MKDIDILELKTRLDKEEPLLVIDVREPYEYEEFNIGSENIPLGNLSTTIPQLEDYKDAEIVMVCRSGNRSGMAKQMLTQAGFTKVRNLLGGMLAWQKQFS